MNGKRRENTHHTCARDTNSSSKSTRTKRCGASGEWWRPPALEMRCSTFPKTTQQRTIKTFPLGENTCKGKLGTAKTVENDSTTPERPRNDSGNQRSFAKLLAAYVSPKRRNAGPRGPGNERQVIHLIWAKLAQMENWGEMKPAKPLPQMENR